MTERIANLQTAIETMHHCKAVHFASETVIELFRGEVAWDGVVETFTFSGHPRAKRCHAWSYEESGETQYVTVLELPPVDSPETAVKVAIATEARQRSMNRRLQTYEKLKEKAASVRTGETLTISQRDSFAIKLIGISDFEALGFEKDAARRIFRSNDIGDFGPLGTAIKGIKIVLSNEANDILE